MNDRLHLVTKYKVRERFNPSEENRMRKYKGEKTEESEKSWNFRVWLKGKTEAYI